MFSAARSCMRAFLLCLVLLSCLGTAHAWHASPTHSGSKRLVALPGRGILPSHVPRGYLSCVTEYNGTYLNEWVDVANDVRSCGGCVAVAVDTARGDLHGRDCTSIPHVDADGGVACRRGRCIVDKCEGRFHRSLDGTRCVEDPPALRVQ